ncbi:molecular chaperone [Klebsiella sp. I138]|uniref:fimbrial biogenesis chaperone n=1 Tax=Klebsiella sp. I138 TaxID=2755385 RepID=UPI003DAA159D
MKPSLIRKIACSCFIMAVTAILPTHASVIVNGTRVIYDSKERDVSVRLTNTGTQPVLVQSWIDDGQQNAKPDHLSTPFTLTPPINRINAGKSQTLRISYTGITALPQNKESVYWLNVLEIPAAQKNEKDSKLQVAFRTRIKLFYRPDILSDRGRVTEAAEKVQWSVAGDKLTAINTSPYFISLVSVTLSNNGRKGSLEGEMVPPLGKYDFRLPGSLRPGTGTTLIYEYVNDWGAVKKVEYIL